MSRMSAFSDPGGELLKRSRLRDLVKSIDRELRILALWSIVVVLVTFSVLLFLYRWIAPHLFDIPQGNTYWNYLDGFVGLGTLAIIVGGLIFTLVEYSNDADRRHDERTAARINMYKEIYDRLMNDQDIEARRWIITHLHPLHPDPQKQLDDKYEWAEAIEKQHEEYSQMPPTEESLESLPSAGDEKAWLTWTRAMIHTPEKNRQGEEISGHEYIKRVMNTFDFLGFVHTYYWSLEDDFAEWMSLPVMKVWRRIGPYVEWEARARHETDDFYYAARELGKYCIKWRVEKGKPESEIISSGL